VFDIEGYNLSRQLTIDIDAPFNIFKELNQGEQPNDEYSVANLLIIMTLTM
jgi:hypothetical protein